MTTKKTKTTTTEFRYGMQVRLNDGPELGTFVVMSNEPYADGSITLYGGDVDRGGYRKYRSIMPDRLKMEDRKEILRKLNRMAA